MATRTIYDGQLAVADADYIHSSVDDEGEEVEAEIEELDATVTSREALRFQLDYPFTKPFDGEVRGGGGGGITLRNIIDAVRAAYREIYRDTTAEPMEKLDNMHVRGPYGEAHHVIEDLVIESIELDEENGTLEIFIGS
jgi:hypothetical protein